MKKLSLHVFTLFLFGLASQVPALAQDSRQTVKGTVLDKSSELPLPHVTVQLAGAGAGVVTDSLGRYILAGVPVGRQRLVFSIMGYKSVSIPEVLVTSGKQVVLDVQLEQQITALNTITVTAGKTRKGMATSEFAGSSARSFSIEDVTRYAGGRNDPAKLASNFAGVSTTDDSRNDIVVRGNSPTAVLWRMEGIPIPNPNHFSTLGTTGGPVSALNTNALKNSDFYTGAFPAGFGNASGAVFDISLRTGNTDQFEKTVQLNLFSGLEAMLEGPLGKKKGASFLVGYRYSFAQVAQSIGFNVGTAAVPKYQDMVFNIQLAPSRAGRFNFFGMAGISNIDFIGKDIDSTDLFANKDEDTYFRSRLAIAGIKHTIEVGRNTYVRSVLSYSYTGNSSHQYKYYDSVAERKHITDQSTDNAGWRFSSFIHAKINKRFTTRAGLLAELTGLNTYLNTRENRTGWEKIRDYDGKAWLLQPFVQAKYRFNDKLSLNAGVHSIYYGMNNAYNIEPRASLSYAPDNTKTITFSYGLHSQLQPLPVYLYQARRLDGTYDQANRELDLTRAQHYIIGYDWFFVPGWRFKAEAYHQQLYDVPVEAIPSGFSVLNAGADFTFPEKAGLVNKGTGTNKGIELTIEKFFSKGFYLLATASVFDATYKGSDGIERNTTFNNRAVFNILAGREWKLGRANRSAFTIDIKVSQSGGRYYTPVNLAASDAAHMEVLDEGRYNSERLPDYFRADARLGFRLNNSKRKLLHTFYVDLQNVSNHDNVFIRRYNQVLKQVGTVYQIGFFPDILYRLQF